MGILCESWSCFGMGVNIYCDIEILLFGYNWTIFRCYWNFTPYVSHVGDEEIVMEYSQTVYRRKLLFYRPGGEGNRSYLAHVAVYTFLGTFRDADFENRWWNVQILGKLCFYGAQSWDIKAWKELKCSGYLTSIEP